MKNKVTDSKEKQDQTQTIEYKEQQSVMPMF